MRAKNVRDVRGCKRYLLHGKPLYSKDLRGYLGNVRDISIIGGEKNMYIQEYLPAPSLISISYNYILAIYNKYLYLGRKRCKFYLLHLLQMIKETPGKYIVGTKSGLLATLVATYFRGKPLPSKGARNFATCQSIGGKIIIIYHPYTPTPRQLLVGLKSEKLREALYSPISTFKKLRVSCVKVEFHIKSGEESL